MGYYCGRWPPRPCKKERFGSSCSVLVSKPEHVLEKIDIDDQTVFLLMTHNYHYDLAMMRALLKRNVAYIGSLGPAKKLDRMLEELRGEGMDITAEMLQKCSARRVSTSALKPPKKLHSPL